MGDNDNIDLQLITPIDEHQKPNQPKNFNFPKRPFGKKSIEYRSFKPVWFEKFQWIHYNENEDKAYCHPCQIASRRRLIKSSKASQAFISTGFSNWNDAHRCFGKHEQSECHLEALQKLNVDKSSTDIGLAMVKQIGDVRENNRSCLMTILSNLQFLSRQGLPFRGSSDDSDSILSN
ncbi:unnamed protein product [Mytilus edulis]|uniref:TTF-type domain-containing protein n=1 Tax=Mytilus edulis TaxID=6550 RepID=A0A8S3SEW7_MYTED|nr:unnamed protein product [Mytilus edulis]